MKQQIRLGTSRLVSTTQALDNLHAPNWRTKPFGLLFPPAPLPFSMVD
jgi:hypothetical protein